MENKIPTMKLIFGSVGASLVLVIVAIIFMVLGAIWWGFAIFVVVVLYGIEKFRKYFIKKYNISMLRFCLLTMLPPIVPFGLFVVYYVYMDNNYWAELEGLFAYIILLVWAGVLVVSIGGTLGIAWIRKIEAMK